MYQYVDRPLTSLDEGCRFLVWSMRAWVTAIAQRRCPAHVLAPAFARWRMIGGLQPFNRVMVLLNRDALETLAFCPMGCSHVSEHEAVILELVTSLRDRGPSPRARRSTCWSPRKAWATCSTRFPASAPRLPSQAYSPASR
ncbi:hypothetical protein ACFSHP_06325 [Novosphingobium panipatense]